MKRQLSVLLTSVMIAGALAGCGAKVDKSAETAETTAATTAAESTAAETATSLPAETANRSGTGGLKTGLAIVSSMKSSKDAGEKDGKAQVSSVAAAVVVDEDGKIISCVLDVAQNKMGFTADGKVIMEDEFKTKKELKDEYNMRASSGIGREWFEQAETIEEYVIGKTGEEVAGIAVDEDTRPTDTDLAASVTVKIGDYVEAITQAVDNAKEIGTQAGDKLGLGIGTHMNKSKDASADKDGQCQAYSTYIAVTTDGDGKITASVIDSTQGTVKFDAAGKITSDISTGVKTKKQLGYDYKMKDASGIGKEWFEQAEALETYMIGKTADEIAGIAVDEDRKPTDADLSSSVTISIGAYQEAVVKAAANAK